MGSPDQGTDFLAGRWPGARAISDPGRVLYRAFGLERAELRQVFGLDVWRAGIGAMRHGVGRPVGDPMQLAGAFAVHDGRIVGGGPAEHAGSPVDLATLGEALDTARASA